MNVRYIDCDMSTTLHTPPSPGARQAAANRHTSPDQQSLSLMALPWIRTRCAMERLCTSCHSARGDHLMLLRKYLYMGCPSLSWSCSAVMPEGSLVWTRLPDDNMGSGPADHMIQTRRDALVLFASSSRTESGSCPSTFAASKTEHYINTCSSKRTQKATP